MYKYFLESKLLKIFKKLISKKVTTIINPRVLDEVSKAVKIEKSIKL